MTDKLTERATLLLSKDEKVALRLLAFVRNTSASNVLRETPPIEIMREYRRLADGLQMSDREIERVLNANDAKTPGT